MPFSPRGYMQAMHLICFVFPRAVISGLHVFFLHVGLHLDPIYLANGRKISCTLSVHPAVYLHRKRDDSGSKSNRSRERLRFGADNVDSDFFLVISTVSV